MNITSHARWRTRRLAALLVASQIVLWACGARVTGLYTDASGATQYEFRPGGEVFISVLGTTVTARYEANAERILVTGPQGTVVLIRKDGRLEGPMGLELTPRHPSKGDPSS